MGCTQDWQTLHQNAPSTWYTYKISGNFMGPLQFQSTGQNFSKIAIWLFWVSNLTLLHWNQLKLSPVSESSTDPYKNLVRFSPLTSRPESCSHKPPYHCPYTGAPDTVPLPDTVWWHPSSRMASRPFQHTHKHSSSLQHTFHTKMAKHHIQWLECRWTNQLVLLLVHIVWKLSTIVDLQLMLIEAM